MDREEGAVRLAEMMATSQSDSNGRYVQEGLGHVYFTPAGLFTHFREQIWSGVSVFDLVQYTAFVVHLSQGFWSLLFLLSLVPGETNNCRGTGPRWGCVPVECSARQIVAGIMVLSIRSYFISLVSYRPSLAADLYLSLKFYK